MQNNVEINDRDFFKNPFSQAEINELLAGKSAAEMFNFRSPSFKQLGVEKGRLSDSELIELMLKEPRLVRRPIVCIAGKVYFGADKSVLAGLLT